MLQPFREECLGDVGKLRIFHILDLHSLEIVGEHLVVGVEIAFALDEDGPGGRIEVVEGEDQAQGKGLLQAKKGGGGDGDTLFTEHIEEADKHSLPPFTCGLVPPAGERGSDPRSS